MSENRIKFAQELVKCLANMDVYRVSSVERAAEQLPSDLGRMIAVAQLDREFRTGLQSMRHGCVYECKGLMDLWFILIRSGEGYLVAGPCILERLPEQELRADLRSTGIPPGLVGELERLYDRQPAMSYDTFHQLGALLARHLLELPEPVPYQQVDLQWRSGQSRDMILVDHYADLIHMRRIELRYEYSAAMTEAVKHGNLSLAYRFAQQMNADLEGLERSADPLRNAQNLCISLNTQLRYALESCGLHPYLLDRLSGDIAVRIEKLKTVEEGRVYVTQVIRQYCELVLENSFPAQSAFARLAVTYIKNHLSDTLTVKDTAHALLVSPNYLSAQFHRETGMTFIDFVNRERVRQAAALLKHTSLQIQQIAVSVGYNNTSYFARQFCRHYQMTPRDYRIRGAM